MPKAKSGRKPKHRSTVWEGGIVRHNRKGEPIFIIQRMIEGTAYKVSTRCHDIEPAREQLRRFEAGPAAYKPAGPPEDDGLEPLPLDETLATAFLVWSRDVGPNKSRKGNSRAWLRKQRSYLAWWQEQLADVDLRELTLKAHVEPALGPELKPGQDGYSTRAKRIAVLKALFSYMRTQPDARAQGLGVTPSQDPLFGALKVPQSDPDSRKTRDKAVSITHIRKAVSKLDGHWKDALTVQAGTGWHVTEVQRFVAGRPVLKNGEEVSRDRGHVEEPRKKTHYGSAVLVCPEAKGGSELRTAVGPEVAEAARRLLGRGTFSVEKYGVAVKEACEVAGVPVFTPGRMRHSVATHAVDEGADMASVASFLNHKSPATTRNFYAKFAVAKKIPTMF